jgi:hypothetical protein
MPGGESLDVGLINDGLVPRCAQRAIVPPGERRVDDHALGDVVRAVAVVAGEIVTAAHGISEDGLVPVHGPVDGSGVRVEQQFGGVEAMPLAGLPRTGDAVAVPLSRTDLRQIDVPDVIRVLNQGDARRLGELGPVEQAQLHAGGVLGEEGEVDAGAVPGRAERIRLAGLGLHALNASNSDAEAACGV